MSLLLVFFFSSSRFHFECLDLIFFSFLLGRFQQFDHGYSGNMKRYQSATPPKYNLSNVQTKMHVIFGSNDNLVSPKVCAHTHSVDLLVFVGTIYFYFSCLLILEEKRRHKMSVCRGLKVHLRVAECGERWSEKRKHLRIKTNKTKPNENKWYSIENILSGHTDVDQKLDKLYDYRGRNEFIQSFGFCAGTPRGRTESNHFASHTKIHIGPISCSLFILLWFFFLLFSDQSREFMKYVCFLS